MKTRLWIDHTTGTWGNVEDLVVVELDEDEISAMAELSDTERCVFAQENGEPVR